jgi:DNA-directed RNA polymerase subunit RPC12/RpoP
MAVETLADAFSAGWRIRVRCAWGPRDGMKRVKECVYGAELDLPTLVWTRGSSFPLGRLESRLKCPRCGSRRVMVLFEPPGNRRLAAGEQG